MNYYHIGCLALNFAVAKIIRFAIIINFVNLMNTSFIIIPKYSYFGFFVTFVLFCAVLINI
jgi:hypothetical protein